MTPKQPRLSTNLSHPDSTHDSWKCLSRDTAFAGRAGVSRPLGESIVTFHLLQHPRWRSHLISIKHNKPLWA